jgi:hypothetical protein
MRALTAAVGQRYRIIGISLDAVDADVTSYIRANRIDFPVLIRPTPDTAERFRLTGTPQTIVLSSSGAVLKSWQGAYVGTVATEISEFFAVQLPGLPRNSTP